ncbi:MAG TPA: AbrB/MazE/SpoVT family DNA-binding domain-containing protein [Hyphomicrobiales bacterium]|nr:AbrB/MazE/SpoVT family DNA-binding domain-containing protein [Hyphomicrobiales bacterium]
MKVRVAKWGNSLAVRIPRTLAAEAGLAEGSAADMVLDEGGALRLEPRASASNIPTLAEMVEEMRGRGPENGPSIVDWGADVGAEIIDDDYSRGDIVFDEATGNYVDHRRR